jgi:hypothetical protein
LARHSVSYAKISDNNAEAECKTAIYVYKEKYRPKQASLDDGKVENGSR